MNDNRLDNVHNANSNYINKSDNSVLPLMSLRGLVVYPNTEVTFDVGRRASIAAVNEAIRRTL